MTLSSSGEARALAVEDEEALSPAHMAAVERLLAAVQELSFSQTLEDVQRIVRTAAREITGCDGATFVLNDGGIYCRYVDEDAIEPLWKGLRFPQDICISGWVMRHRQPVVIPDIYADPRIPQDAYRPTFVKSLVMVPIRTMQPLGAIGNYWAHHYEPTTLEVQMLQSLADSTSVAMENIRIQSEIEQQIENRTHELQQANSEIQKHATTDDLTGLLNRRGFEARARASMRRGTPFLLAFLDVDGLKKVNDQQGHAQGDALLKDVAEAIRTSFRESDIIARMGGDEFCVLMTRPSIDAATLKARMEAHVAQMNASLDRPYRISISMGAVEATAQADGLLDTSLEEADRRMYQEKARRKAARRG
ncbi:diguanylate cyclase domain-containing protein [Xanthobacter sp. TB0139]|uniref:diguanylate cyclase domain-containing protein n=1 Tax=Xanthobacter sp. TB0139 TaxID=3459178 RepID=UPI0040393FF8